MEPWRGSGQPHLQGNISAGGEPGPASATRRQVPAWQGGGGAEQGTPFSVSPLSREIRDRSGIT